MSAIRPPDEADRGPIGRLLRLAFNPPPARAEWMVPHLRLERFLCAYEPGGLVAMGQAYPLEQFFGGHPLPAAGVAMVAAVPERRGAGVTSGLMEALLRRARSSGALLATLYPSRASFYRRLGFEYAGLLTQFRLSLAELPAGAPGGAGVREAGEGDLAALRDCYRRFAARHSGPVDCAEEDWWRLRVLRRGVPDANVHAVRTPPTGEVRGYAAFLQEPVPDNWGYRIVCSHLIAETGPALRDLLAFFAGHRGLAQSLLWYGPPNEPVGLVAGLGGDSPSIARGLRFMCRLLDVPAALEARGWPAVRCGAVLAVEDDLFEENRGPFRIEADGGRLRVERLEGDGGREALRLPVGALSALFSGHLSPGDLARAGRIEPDHPALPALTGLFAGPPCWMTDFF